MQKSVTRARAVPPRVVPPKVRNVPAVPGTRAAAVPSTPAAAVPGTRAAAVPGTRAAVDALLEAGAQRPNRMVRRVAAGVLMSAVVAGGTAGATLAASRDVPDSAPAVVRPADLAPAATPTPSTAGATAGTSARTTVQDVVFSNGSPLVFTWPSASATKSTAVRLVDPDQGVVRRAGTATRVAVVWAVAATVAMGGLLAGSVLQRR